MFVKRSTIPVASFGRTSENPIVTVSDNGQIRFNKFLLANAIGEKRKLLVDWDAETRIMSFIAVSAPPKGLAEDDLFEIKVNTKKGSDEAIQAYFGGASMLRLEELAIGYDFQKSGTQMFTASIVEKGKAKSIQIVLPQGAMTPRPRKERKDKPAAAKSVATPVVPAAPVADDDDLLG